MKTRRLAAATAAIALALTGSLMIASPASAAPGNCANSSVCGYGDTEYRTGQGYEFVTGSAGECVNVGLRNTWSSVFNNAGRTVRLYRNVNCANGVWTLSGGDGLSAISLFQPSWNNTIESVRF